MDRMRNTSVETTFEENELVMVRQKKEDQWTFRRYAGMIEGSVWPHHCFQINETVSIPWRYIEKIK